MRTRKTSAKPDKPTDPENINPEVSPASKDAKVNERISFYVDDNGIPQWDRLSTKTTGQLKEIFKNSEAQTMLGFVPPVSEGKTVEETKFDETEVNAILDLLQIIKATGASRIYDIPAEVTTQAFTYTPLQREKLTLPFAKLMNKWGPAMMKTWKDEIGAAIVFLSVTNAQIRMMHHLDAKRKANQPRIVQIREPKPVAENSPPVTENKTEQPTQETASA